MLSIALGGVCAGISLSPGSSFQLIAASAESKEALLDSLLGQVRTCVVSGDGGLISNLSVAENIALPAEFHRVGSAADRASRLRELTGRFGEDGAAIRTLEHAHPARLSPLQRRLAGFLRAMLMEPKLMVFDSLLEGISRANAAKLREFKRIFHLYFPFRHVAFVNFADEPLLQGLIDHTYHL
jgi:ABC-type lipoprotein export system ATPase subunit